MKYLKLFESIDDNYIKNTVANYKNLLKSLVPLATEKVKENPDKKKKNRKW